MGEPVRTVRVVRVCGHRALDFRPRRRELPILGQRHGMLGKEPEIIAVMRGEAVHQRRDLLLLPEAAGGAYQAVRVCGSGQHQGIAWPCPQMGGQSANRCFGLTREGEVEISDVTSLAVRQAVGSILGRGKSRPRRCHIALPRQHLRFRGVSQGKMRVGCDGAVKGLDRAGVKGQRQIAALDVCVARRGRGGGQGEVISVCQHSELPPGLVEGVRQRGSRRRNMAKPSSQSRFPAPLSWMSRLGSA
jgi:hypothetical protein